MKGTSRAIVALAFIPACIAAQATPRLDTGKNLLADVTFTAGELSFGAIGPDGDIVMLDDQNGRIYRFRSDGTFRNTFSRTGDGPGEFRTAAGIAISPSGEIAVADLTSRRVIFWDADGKSIGQAAIPSGFPVAMTGWNAGPTVALTDFQRTLRFAVIPLRGAARVIGSIPIAVPGGALTDEVGCDLCATLLLPSGNRLVGATRDSTYRLLEFDNAGAVVKRWIRPAERPLELSDEELRQRMGQGSRMGNAEARASGGPPGRPDRGRFRFPPRIVGLAHDGEGRIWVRANHDVEAGSTFDIFTPSSQFLGMIQVPQRITGFAISGTQLVAWGASEDGEPAVWLYRIVP